MKTRFLLSLFLMTSMASFCATVTISTSGLSFTPGTTNIDSGDEVFFNLGSPGLGHNVLEVSQSTYNSDGTTPLPGGFQLSSSGTVPSSSLAAGTTHWYVCTTHIGFGMKGIIIVGPTMGIQNYVQTTFSVFPNPTEGLITVKAGENIIGSSYSITDQCGRLVVEGKLNDVTLSTQIDINHLTMGVYFLQVGDDRKLSFKLIKK